MVDVRGDVLRPPHGTTQHKLMGHIGFGLCIRPSVQQPCMLGFFKFHMWIPHGKIFDTRFFSCPSYLPFWSYAPSKKSERI